MTRLQECVETARAAISQRYLLSKMAKNEAAASIFLAAAATCERGNAQIAIFIKAFPFTC